MKNLNHIHKYSKDILSVIIILGTDVHGGETCITNSAFICNHLFCFIHSTSQILPIFYSWHFIPYLGSYSGQKGQEILQQPWIIALAKSVETFIIVSINDMPTVKYWKILGSTMDKSK